MASDEKKGGVVQEIDEIRKFVFMAQEGLCTKDDIKEKIARIIEKINCAISSQKKLQGALAELEAACNSERESNMMEFFDKYGSQEQILERIDALEKECTQWESMLSKLEELLSEKRNFDKTLCFSNIRELLRQNPEVKIGQIEKEAGIRLGYMSRMEKDGNTAEPSMEFIITASKLLKVSIDTLVSINLAVLTPHEQYIVKFFDKLKADTIADKLDWNSEKAFDLNHLDTDENGQTSHPLFSYGTFYDEGEHGYPEPVSRIAFPSNTFGYNTFIKDDCFNLRLKNGTVLYLMSVEKNVHHNNDSNAIAIEAWLFVPRSGSSVLVTSLDGTPIAPIVADLYETVKLQMKHPKINKDALIAIDAFMNDDIDDDEIPF